MTHHKKPVAIAMGTALAGGLMLSGSAFSVTPLGQGYLLSAQDAAATDAQAAAPKAVNPKAAEGKCGEGKCGIATFDADKDGKVSQAEFTARHPDKADKFASIDANGDGFIDNAEYDAHKAARKADKQADKKSDAEGKCGEGKCGEGKCGGMA